MYIVYPCKSVNVPCPNEEKYFFSMWIEKKRIFVVAMHGFQPEPESRNVSGNQHCNDKDS